MKKNKKKRLKKIGTPPGTLIYTGLIGDGEIGIDLIEYNENNFSETKIKDIKKLAAIRESPHVSWIDVTGLHKTEIIEAIGKIFGLHQLVLEDILNINQRPKLEDYDNYLFIVVKMLTYNETDAQIYSEQVTFILGKNFVITFQEKAGDVFEIIRQRLRTAKGRIRKMNADYLAYALIDTIVDQYFIILEKIGENIENIEDELISDPDKDTLLKIHKLKSQLISLRKSVWPLREVISRAERLESLLFRESTAVFLRDLYDHTIQVIDNVETFRDMVSGMLDIYLSSVSNKMNEVMKVLTIIATIFIPLTFIVGVYGMNFDFMPELRWHWGYPAVMLFMFVLGVLMILYFKKKKWF